MKIIIETIMFLLLVAAGISFLLVFIGIAIQYLNTETIYPVNSAVQTFINISVFFTLLGNGVYIFSNKKRNK